MAQLLFILLVVVIVALLWRSRESAHGRAWKRLLLAGFGILVIVTILAPELSSRAANVIGIGRGSDLVFYLTSFALMLMAALVYLRFRRVDERIAELTRQLALSEWQRERAAAGGDTD